MQLPWMKEVLLTTSVGLQMDTLQSVLLENDFFDSSLGLQFVAIDSAAGLRLVARQVFLR